LPYFEFIIFVLAFNLLADLLKVVISEIYLNLSCGVTACIDDRRGESAASLSLDHKIYPYYCYCF